MKRGRLLVAALAAVALAAPAAARAGVRILSVDTSAFPDVSVTVLTGTRSASAPEVRENGVAAGDVRAANLGRGKNVVLAIDRSRSMAGAALAQAAAAADDFVLAKPARDAIEVVAFGRQALALTGFSTATIDADGALRSIAVDPHEGTALYDAVVLASHALAKHPVGARVLILLTDGHDISSTATLAEAVAAAVQAHVAVYPIAIAGAGATPAPLRQLARETGGSFFRAADASALGAVYSAIASQLARTWRISYLSTQRPGDRVALRVSVPGQGAAARDVQVPGVAGHGPAPSRLLPASFYRSTAGTIVVASVAGFFVLLGLLALLAARKATWVKQRLEPHVDPAGRGPARTIRERLAFAAGVVRSTEQLLGDLRQFRALARLLERADVPLRAAEFAYVMAGTGIVAGLVAVVATGSGLAGVAGFAAGAALPAAALSFKARRRLRRFDDQLPDLLVTLAASLKAGHSFRQGIQSVVNEGQEPAADEFRRVLTDTRLGRPMDDSLAEMAERLGSKNFAFVINAVAIQRQVGGSLASLFDMVAETVRHRQQFARKIRGLTAMGRMSAYILVGLPFGLALLLTVLNPAFMQPLWATHPGHIMIATGLTMMTVGSFILKKIVSFRG